MPPSAEMRTIYSAAERKFATLSAKYTWLLSANDAVPAADAGKAAPPAKGKGAVEEPVADDAPIVVRCAPQHVAFLAAHAGRDGAM